LKLLINDSKKINLISILQADVNAAIDINEYCIVQKMLLSGIPKNLNDEIFAESNQLTNPNDEYLYESTVMERKILIS
jgi:hypothetical protein